MLFIYGFPGVYGGANTELHHQITIWLSLGLEVHLVPSGPEYVNSPLLPEMTRTGVVIHAVDEFSAIERDAPVFGYCNRKFLENINAIRLRSINTVWVNCMTYLCDLEKRRMAEGKIRTFLYQTPSVRDAHRPILRRLNQSEDVQFLLFVPYFDTERFPMVAARRMDTFGCGRISRGVAEKYAANTLRIYRRFASPKPKRGLFLGFNERCEAKTGRPYSWIRTALNHTKCSQAEFYRHCEIVLQPSDLIENWPRVAFEAMSSGSVLIVDNRGGWRRQIQHGATGWLCDTEEDFVRYASKMAYEPNLRSDMARRARERVRDIAGASISQESWAAVLKAIL